MGKRLSLSLLGLLALTIAFLAIGCGTVCNLAGGFVHPEDQPRVYGGMQIDLEGFQSLLNDHWSMNLGSSSSSSGQSTALVAIAVLGLMGAEPVLTFVGDTLTLPITLWAEYRRDVEREAAESDKEPAASTARRIASIHRKTRSNGAGTSGNTGKRRPGAVIDFWPGFLLVGCEGVR